jgi:hypothetical protein
VVVKEYTTQMGLDILLVVPVQKIGPYLVWIANSAKLNGSDKKELLYDQGNLTGIAYAELPLTLA